MSDQIDFNQSEITQNDKLLAAFGYPIPLIALILLFMEDKKARPFLKYHAVQSLAVNVVLWVVMVILAITVVGAICAPILWFVTLWPAIEAYQGKYMELPVITDFLKNQGWVD
ncbi:MAG: DUF4870 domain-containing protein [Anaerolineales bacterium]|nr:DUF4870 domain-containing protein [Anaerolineales bacterium]